MIADDRSRRIRQYVGPITPWSVPAWPQGEKMRSASYGDL
jgi:hypothetical protein